jgi:prolycopene isomerase
VDQILVEDGKVAGVRVSRNRSAESHVVRAPYVVAACDIASLYEKALPDVPGCKAHLEKIAKADMYESIFAINVGLSVDVRELGFGEDMIFLTADGIGRDEHNDTDPHKAGMYVIAPSARDPSLAPPGRGTLSIQVMAAMEYGDYWKTEPGFVRGKAYHAFKHEYANVLFERIEAALAPDLRRYIECCDIATPVTHWRYTGNHRGSIMGSRPTRQNFRSGVASYHSPVKNLLIGGHWAENGGGVPVAVRAGVNSALLILKKERPAAFRLFSRVIDGKLAPEACVSPDIRVLSLPVEGALDDDWRDRVVGA